SVSSSPVAGSRRRAPRAAGRHQRRPLPFGRGPAGARRPHALSTPLLSQAHPAPQPVLPDAVFLRRSLSPPPPPRLGRSPPPLPSQAHPAAQPVLPDAVFLGDSLSRSRPPRLGRSLRSRRMRSASPNPDTAPARQGSAPVGKTQGNRTAAGGRPCD